MDDDIKQVPIARLMELCNPFTCWVESETITASEVQDCLRQGGQAIVHTPCWIDVAVGSAGISEAEAKERHVRKIAFFAANEPIEPIVIDVGCPSVGYYPGHIIEDGNHRLAGSVVAGRSFISAIIIGDEDYAVDLGLLDRVSET